MEKCSHIAGIELEIVQEKLSDPVKWKCQECGTTESVWACLHCGHRGCGREQKHHAEQHYRARHTRGKRKKARVAPHCLAFSLNLKTVHCYACNDYVFNDNDRGEIQLLRQMLISLETSIIAPTRTRSGRIVGKSMEVLVPPSTEYDDADILSAVLRHWKYRSLAKAFSKWRAVVQEVKETQARPELQRFSSSSIISKLPEMPRGRTGLRNLGNTCYLNSILQAMSQIPSLREFFISLIPENSNMGPNAVRGSLPLRFASPRRPNGRSGFSPRIPSTTSHRLPPQNQPIFQGLERTSTEVCLQQVVRRPSGRQQKGPEAIRSRDNLLSLQSPAGRTRKRSSLGPQPLEDVTSLCIEMHRLMRVLWSGKWELVTPHSLLTAVWKYIPICRGYRQQDAQEFMDNMLSVIGSECKSDNDMMKDVPESTVSDLFGTRIMSTVICSRCRRESCTTDPSYGLAIDFPTSNLQKTRSSATPDSVIMDDCLSSFTKWESLGQSTYRCDKCFPRRGLTTAKKRILIDRCAPVLELQLKRFTWTSKGQTKTQTHVRFPLSGLDISPYMSRSGLEEAKEKGTSLIYDLSGVVVHWGRGWGGGHYTYFGRHADTGIWLSFNDEEVKAVNPEEVAASQAYMLFYLQRDGFAPDYALKEQGIHLTVKPSYIRSRNIMRSQKR